MYHLSRSDAAAIVAASVITGASFGAVSGHAVGWQEGFAAAVAERDALAERNSQLTADVADLRAQVQARPDQGIVCAEDQVHGTIDGVDGVHCLTPGDPYVVYVPGQGWKAD